MQDRSFIRMRLTDDLVALQEVTISHPYSIVHRLKLAKAYRALGYPDLSIGDAYKALLLIDEVTEELEYYDDALEAAKEDFITEKIATVTLSSPGAKIEGEEDRDDEVLEWAKTECSRTAYDLLIQGLLDCGNYRSAFGYIARAQKAFPGDATFDEYDTKLSDKVHSYFEAKGEDVNGVDIEEYPDKGLVRRERYRWSSHEPDRSSEECLQILNAEIASIAPRLEVRISELPLMSTKVAEDCSGAEVQYVKQLGLFAKEDLAPGDTVLEEKSLLTAISRLHDSYCDACSIELPTMQEATGGTSTDRSISCEECEEVFFCSTECHDLAQDYYHPAVCGVSVDQGKVPAREAADSLYTLLLIRALALAQTQETHPLELKEIRYIWGDYIGHDLDQIWRADPEGQAIDGFGAVPQTLPFSFKSTILTPLHILEKMDVNIYTEQRYDTWVINTIYAKLRGTASARQGLDLRPEIGAVHPMWCLANHSCDPNVAWEWQGIMKLWTRKELVDWSSRDPTRSPGIKQGDEIFSHYCDVRLPVKERREWAAGALGGECICQRCVREETEELRHSAITQ